MCTQAATLLFVRSTHQGHSLFNSRRVPQRQENWRYYAVLPVSMAYALHESQGPHHGGSAGMCEIESV